MRYLAVALLVVAGCDGTRSLTPHEQPIAVSLDTLFQDFIDNGIAAEHKYSGKRLRIYGIIAAVDKDRSGQRFVEVRRPNKTINDGVVYCLFSRSYDKALSELQPGWSLNSGFGIVGTFSRGKVFGLSDCCFVTGEGDAAKYD